MEAVALGAPKGSLPNCLPCPPPAPVSEACSGPDVLAIASLVCELPGRSPFVCHAH